MDKTEAIKAKDKAFEEPLIMDRPMSWEYNSEVGSLQLQFNCGGFLYNNTIPNMVKLGHAVHIYKVATSETYIVDLL